VKLRVKTEKKCNEKRKIINIFQNSKWKQEYGIELNNRLEILENMELKPKRVFLFFVFGFFVFYFFK
jgi:hypothetical protein